MLRNQVDAPVLQFAQKITTKPKQCRIQFSYHISHQNTVVLIVNQFPFERHLQHLSLLTDFVQKNSDLLKERKQLFVSYF